MVLHAAEIHRLGVVRAERHPRRHFLAVSVDRCGARRRCRAPVFQRAGERAGACRHGRVFDRRRAGADHRLRHRLGDDAKSRDDHPADVVRPDCRRRVEADHAARGVPRARRGNHPQARRGDAADPAGDGARAGRETVALGRVWVQDSAMKVDGKPFRTIWRDTQSGNVAIIDQTKLPHAFVIAELRSVEDAWRAISEMQVRGAPLIGVAAAYGLALAMRADASDTNLAAAADYLATARPTAVNLAWALDEMRRVLAPVPPSHRTQQAF